MADNPENIPRLTRVFFDVEHARMKFSIHLLHNLYKKLRQKDVPRSLLLDIYNQVNEACPWVFKSQEVPISLGMIEDVSNRYFYCAFDSFDKSLKADQLDRTAGNWQFVLGTVLKHVYDPEEGVEKPRFISDEKIKKEILDFLRPTEVLELWAKHGERDLCILQDIFGGRDEFIAELKKKGVQYVIFKDTNNLRIHLGNPTISVSVSRPRHTSVNDARTDMREFNEMVKIVQERENAAERMRQELTELRDKVCRILDEMSGVHSRVFAPPEND